MMSFTTPIKIAIAAACLVAVAVIIAVDVARTRGQEPAPAPVAPAMLVEAYQPALPPKPAAEAVICPTPAPEAPKPAPVVEAPKPVVQEPPKTYTIVQGDSLYGISQKLFGTPRHVERLYQLNKDRIRDPNTLQVGINLRVPEVAASSSAR